MKHNPQNSTRLTKLPLLALFAAAFMLGSASLQAAAVIYEPFADSNATLDGNTPGTGLTSTWAVSAQTSWTVGSPSLVYGALPTSGNKATGAAQGGNSITTGTVAANTLKTAGLLEHGATLWFSFLWKTDDAAANNGDAAFSFGTAGLTGANGTGMNSSGNGIGVSISTSSGNLSAATWGGGTKTGGASAAWGIRTVPKLIVGKIVWGSDATQNDTVYIYTPGTDLVLSASFVSSKTAVLDQSLFNTISFSTKTEGDPQIDEIRFGATYLDVIGASPVAAYWDLNGTTAGACASGNTAPNTWDTAANAYWNATADGTTTTPAIWTAGQAAVFAAGTDATGTYGVTVSGTPSIGGLTFEEGTVTISGGTALDLVSAGGTLDVRTSLNETISTPISQTTLGGNLYKDGSGTLTLSGNNTYDCPTIVAAGTLILSGDNSAATGGMTLSGGITRFDSTNAIPGTGRTVTNNAVVMFGTLDNTDIATGLGRIATNASAGNIAADNNASGNFNLSAAGLTNLNTYFGAVGTVNYTGTLTPNGNYRLGGAGGTLTMVNTNALTGAGKTLTVSGPGTVVLATNNNYTGTTAINSGGTLILADTNSATTTTINGGGTLIVGNSNSIGGAGITLNGALVIGSSSAFNLGANSIFFSTGASIRSDSTTARSIAGRLNGNANNTIILGNAVNNGKLTFTVASTFSSSATTFQCESDVEFSAAFTTGLGGGVTKTGPATLIFSTANLFTGNNFINAGTMKIGNANALGYGGPQTSAQGTTTVASGATLDLAGATGVNEPITLNGTGVGANGALINSSTAASIGNGVAGVTAAATGIGSGYGAAPAVTFTGGGGSGAAATATSRGVTAASFTITGGTQTYSVAPTVTITVGGGAGATAAATLSGNPGTVTGITITAAGTGFTSAPTIAFSAGTVAVAGTLPTGTGNALNFCVSGITMTAAGSGYTTAPTLNLNGSPVAATVTRTSVALGAASSIGGSGDITIDAVVSGAGANTLTKVGGNTLTLSGANTNSGATAVNAGTLLITGNSAGVTNVVTVVTNATFGGTGIIGGTTRYQNGAQALFSVGSPMTFTNAAFLTNVTVKVDLGTALGAGTYVLATNYVGFTSIGSLTFATNSGTLAASTTGYVTNDTTAKEIQLVVIGGAGVTVPNLNYTNAPSTSLLIPIASITNLFTSTQPTPTYTFVNIPATSTGGGTIVTNATTIQYTPLGNPVSDTFTYYVNDGVSTSAAGTITVYFQSVAGAQINPASITTVGGTNRFTFQGIPSTGYHVQFATTLSPTPDWTNADSGSTTGLDGSFVWTDSVSQATRLSFTGSVFYRISYP